jgi:hypothetical protein
LAWKERFYEMYEDKFNSMSNTTLISKKKYLYMVECLKSIDKKGPKQISWSEDEKRFHKKYKLLTNVKYKCLYRKAKNDQWLQVPFYENIWDIMHKTHQGLSHPRDLKKKGCTE